MSVRKNTCRLIAYYLPQFHPIPENDKWWGKGFTEWTNVAKAKPLFPGHYQPHLPADFGFYDLRVPEVRAAQADLARQHGIEGFCYWHYWFAGKQYLERPFQEVLKSGEPNFPFCLAWANHSWTGPLQGAYGKMLIDQTYPGPADHQVHFYALLDAFGDSRYMTLDGKPIFVIYRPKQLPETLRFTDQWRELAVRSGLKGIFFLAVAEKGWLADGGGFDATILDSPNVIWDYYNESGFLVFRTWRRIYRRVLHSRFYRYLPLPMIYQYRDAIQHALPLSPSSIDQYPCVIPNWDNTPRGGLHGTVLHNSSPDLFRLHLKQALDQTAHLPPPRRLIFIKSWNEWAEGNYLEPDKRFGKAYLEAVRDSVCGSE